MVLKSFSCSYKISNILSCFLGWRFCKKNPNFARQMDTDLFSPHILCSSGHHTAFGFSARPSPCYDLKQNFVQPWKRNYSARCPQVLNLTTSKMEQFYETSSMFELDNVKNEAILRDVFIFQSWQHQKRSKSARLPQFLNLTTSKTKQFCETSSFFELDNIQNEAILRDIFNFWTGQHQKQSNSARLPSKMGWRPRTIAFCDFSTPPV